MMCARVGSNWYTPTIPMSLAFCVDITIGTMAFKPIDK